MLSERLYACPRRSDIAVSLYHLACWQAVKSVGVKGLYSGLQASVLGTAVSQGVYFYLCALLIDLPAGAVTCCCTFACIQQSTPQQLPTLALPSRSQPARTLPEGTRCCGTPR